MNVAQLSNVDLWLPWRMAPPVNRAGYFSSMGERSELRRDELDVALQRLGHQAALRAWDDERRGIFLRFITLLGTALLDGVR